MHKFSNDSLDDNIFLPRDPFVYGYQGQLTTRTTFRMWHFVRFVHLLRRRSTRLVMTTFPTRFLLSFLLLLVPPLERRFATICFSNCLFGLLGRNIHETYQTFDDLLELLNVLNHMSRQTRQLVRGKLRNIDLGVRHTV